MEIEQLKKAFTTVPLLIYPDHTQEIQVEMDASGFALGAVLSIKCGNSHWRLVAFLSKSLTPIERNWPIYDKELFAIICTERMETLFDWMRIL